MLAHLGGLLLGFVAPLICYLVLKDRGPFVREHSATALNFQLTILIGYLVGVVLVFAFIGVLIVPAVAVLALVFSIIASIKAYKGEWYRYPVAIPFIR